MFDETCGVEFEGGAIRGRGFCDAKTLKAALRKDFFDLLKPEYKDMNVRDIIYTTGLIRRSYDFKKFVNLFVEELIPSQASVAVERLVMNLNPMNIEVFGES